jgi:FADH2 O2-dependent halogenase
LNHRYDIAVIGSGFAGSLFAMIARQLGHSVVLIERGKHPRVVIGESSTPLTNLLLEELAARYDLPQLAPLAKWGSWQRTYPNVACGLKRGFTFYHHDLNLPTTDPSSRENQLLVAASPNDEIADTHWYRADFDHLLVRQAESIGVEYFDRTYISSVTELDDGLVLEGSRSDSPIEISARFVVDASGPCGVLHRALLLGEAEIPNYPATQAIYGHFSGVGRIEGAQSRQVEVGPPYPVNDAAVHHVFDGGWVWVLQFNNGITSAGVAATEEMAAELEFDDPEEAWSRVLRKIPVLQRQFAAAQLERPLTHLPQLSFRSAKVSGANWALMPSAAGFVDPLLSTGFPLALMGVQRLAEIVESSWGTDSFTAQLAGYASATDADLLATARLIGSLYAHMGNFPVFTTLALLYFAAVSFAETARRLGKPQLASSFLLRDHPSFGPASAQLFARSRHVHAAAESVQLTKDILHTIEPFNLARFGDQRLGNWYPLETADLYESAWKVGADSTDISNLLTRCGFR